MGRKTAGESTTSQMGKSYFCFENNSKFRNVYEGDWVDGERNGHGKWVLKKENYIKETSKMANTKGIHDFICFKWFGWVDQIVSGFTSGKMEELIMETLKKEMQTGMATSFEFKLLGIRFGWRTYNDGERYYGEWIRTKKGVCSLFLLLFIHFWMKQLWSLLIFRWKSLCWKLEGGRIWWVSQSFIKKRVLCDGKQTRIY